MTPKKLSAATKIARALADLDLDELRAEATKDSNILMRITSGEKAEIKSVADALKLSVSEYLLLLHRHVRDRIRQ